LEAKYGFEEEPNGDGAGDEGTPAEIEAVLVEEEVFTRGEVGGDETRC